MVYYGRKRGSNEDVLEEVSFFLERICSSFEEICSLIEVVSSSLGTICSSLRMFLLLLTIVVPRIIVDKGQTYLLTDHHTYIHSTLCIVNFLSFLNYLPIYKHTSLPLMCFLLGRCGGWFASRGALPLK